MPPVDELNRALAGRLFFIPLVVGRQQDAPRAPVDHLGVEVSYDRDATWQRAIVLRSGDRGLAIIHHPRAGGGTVSIRASAADRDGNTVEETILDGYHLLGD